MRSINILLVGLGVIGVASAAGSAAESPVRPVLIFMQPSDALEPVGMLTFEANPLTLRGPVTPAESEPAASQPAESARGSHAKTGPGFRAMLGVPQPDGGCLVFGGDSREAGGDPKIFSWRVYRARTRDGLLTSARLLDVVNLRHGEGTSSAQTHAQMGRTDAVGARCGGVGGVAAGGCAVHASLGSCSLPDCRAFWIADS